MMQRAISRLFCRRRISLAPTRRFRTQPEWVFRAAMVVMWAASATTADEESLWLMAELQR